MRATLRVVFHELPRLLIVHLGRFTFEPDTGNSKVHKAVRFDTKLQCVSFSSYHTILFSGNSPPRLMAHFQC